MNRTASTPAAASGACPLGGPAWCTADHRGDTPASYAHGTAETSGVIKTVDPRTGDAGAVAVDVEQTDTDPRPVIVLHGSDIDSVCLDPATAEHVAVEILAHLVNRLGHKLAFASDLVEMLDRNAGTTSGLGPYGRAEALEHVVRLAQKARIGRG